SACKTAPKGASWSGECVVGRQSIVPTGLSYLTIWRRRSLIIVAERPEARFPSGDDMRGLSEVFKANNPSFRSYEIVGEKRPRIWRFGTDAGGTMTAYEEPLKKPDTGKHSMNMK